jgi:hypothetical protein
MDQSCKAFVERLADQNRAFYGTPDGRGTLRAFELTFEHRWIYLFELVQNALDAGARSISIHAATDSLVFQHDGDAPLREGNVEGLSKIFRSTKGAATVGFMGIGFKSVFRRFRDVRVSGWGWTFRYDVSQVVGTTYGDVQPDLLGAVLPTWDDSIQLPDKGFTTRFALAGLVDTDIVLASDLSQFLSASDRTPLAILAASKLTRLEVNGEMWELGVIAGPHGSQEATAISVRENLLWQLFPAVFEPSPKAIARFLEHRRIQPEAAERERVYADAARPRQVLGVLPLDDEGRPVPPGRGRVYATLPTDVTLPFGIHVNADWLLNISRTGLRDVEDDPWQREIADCIADVLARFLAWVGQACTQREAAQSAYSALALPKSEGHGPLEGLLADGKWLATLAAHLEDVECVPQWTERDALVSFSKPAEVLLPPKPFTDAFSEEPALDPAALFKARILDRELVGKEGLELFQALGLLQEMTPSVVAAEWADGLEAWWQHLPADDTVRRDLLFRLWAAVGELADRAGWGSHRLLCVRTVSGRWLSVSEIRYFNEPLPSDREPGGAETRALLEGFLPDLALCLPDTWVGALRQAAGKGGGLGPVARARVWLESRGNSVDLHSTVSAAVDAMARASQREWTPLCALGRWAMHRNRSDLLTHVLVETAEGEVGVPVAEAIVADPYVERGENRRRLYATRQPISSAYLRKYSTDTDAHGWRTLFEKAGARGQLELRAVQSTLWQSNREGVAAFIGAPISTVGEANASGYTLTDFHIEPRVPDADASSEVRVALARVLEDGFSALHGKGRRKARYFYYTSYERTGDRPSDWVRRLCELEWVPCRDGGLRRPSAVLPRPDPAREEAPVADVSQALIDALDREGLAFGADVPQAPALRKLMKLGSTLDATAMAILLGEVREESRDANDSRLYSDAVASLLLPLRDGRRVPISRVVQRVGGRLRGPLGGWTVPLNEISEPLREELSRPDWPYAFPSTTTGHQAMGYIENTWSRALVDAEGLANEVRTVLPTAYTYVLEDVATDSDLVDRWKRGRSNAAVFAGREWIDLGSRDEPVYLDDIEDRRFVPPDVSLRTATAGHLGNSPEQQLATAKALGLLRLSSIVALEWQEVGEHLASQWEPRFALVCELLGRIRGGEEGKHVVASVALRLRHWQRLEVTVRLAGAEPLRVRINARLSHGILDVAGSPVAFASDAAKELLRDLSFRQRGDLGADLTGLLAAIDSPEDFALAVEKCVRAHVLGFEVPDAFKVAGEQPMPNALPTVEEPPVSGEQPKPAQTPTPPAPPGQGGSYDRDRALAAQKALADKLRLALKGELALEREEIVETGSGPSGGSGELGDEYYREVVVRYERECGREPLPGDPRQEGWDVESINPTTGERRLIEVKGKGCGWSKDEVVELTRAQVRKAFQSLAEDTETTTWYLYVVEQSTKGIFEVLPIPNPVALAGKWLLRGADWRMVAEGRRQISPETPVGDAPDTT